MATGDKIVNLDDLKAVHIWQDAEKFLASGARKLATADWEGGNVVRAGDANGNNGTKTFAEGYVRNIYGIGVHGGTKANVLWDSNFSEFYIICYDKTLPSRGNSRQLAFLGCVTVTGTSGEVTTVTLEEGTEYIRCSVKLAETEETVAATVEDFDIKVSCGIQEELEGAASDSASALAAKAADIEATDRFRELEFERGGLQTGTGKPITNANFVRSINWTYGGITIKAPDGYKIRHVWYFDEADESYVGDANVSEQTFEIPATVKDGNDVTHTIKAKITVCNATNPTTTPVVLGSLQKASKAAYLVNSLLPVWEERYYLHTCVDKTKTAIGSGDKIVAIGDSITVNFAGAGVEKNWSNYLATITGATLVRKAKGGAGFVYESDSKKMIDMVDAVTADTDAGGWADVKVAFILAGTNDRKSGITVSNIRTAVEAVITAIHDETDGNPDTHIVFITPLRRKRSDMSGMADIAAAIAYTALTNGCSVINGFDIPIPMETMTDRGGLEIVEDLSDDGSGTADGLHPGVTGMQILARSVLNAIM